MITRQIRISSDMEPEKVKAEPGKLMEMLDNGVVPQIGTTHDMANTVSCMAAEQVVAAGRKFHEIYASSQDTPEDFRRKTSALKDDEVAIFVRHENEYDKAMMDAVWNFMYRYKERLIVIILRRKHK